MMQTIILGICACSGAFALGWSARNGLVKQLEAKIEAVIPLIEKIYYSLPERRLNKSETLRIRQRAFDAASILGCYIYKNGTTEDVPEEGAEEIARAVTTALLKDDEGRDLIVRPGVNGMSEAKFERPDGEDGDQPEQVEPLAVEPGGSKEGTRQSYNGGLKDA